MAAPQPTAPASGATGALDQLQSMINLVLIQSGQFLREQQAGGGSGRAKYRMKKLVPTAIDRFQSSLDEIESEIQQAQAVLRRDLALRQADRLQREQAEAAERQRVAAASSAKSQGGTASEGKPDTVVDEPPAASETVVLKQEQLQTPQADDASRPDTHASAPPQDELPPPEDSATSAAQAGSLFDDTLAPSTAHDDNAIDFDAIFGPDGSADDAEMHNADNQGDIKMDNSSGAGDLEFNLDDSGPSLLRGLEDFAKGGEDASAQQSGTDPTLDFSMPDLPDVAPSQPSNQPSNSKAEEESKPQQSAENTNNNDDIMETMTTDNLDDLFNIDYDDQEPSGFDDAFSAYDWK